MTQESADPLPDVHVVRKVRVVHHSWPVRAVALVLATFLFLNSSPPLLAITMGQIKAGTTSGAGGQGSAPNLVNAGAASAALTEALTKKSQQQAADVVAAMQKLQAQAAKSAKANPATVLPNGQTVNGDTTVYNGLKAGWLEPYVKGGGSGIVNGTPVTTSWSGAAITPSQSPANAANPNYVNIQQSSQNAYLYWNKFNVGPKTTVNFDQSKGGATVGNWIAFNKVMSATDPSHVFGNITAQGQVWILNQNGLLFHNGSTVNTHTLVASTLPINRNLAGDALDGVTGSGIANNPDNQFLFSGLKIPSGKNGPTPSFDPSLGSVPQSTTPGDVVVETGATIVSPPNSAGVGGLVALVGPNVRNDGTISTAGGQTVLAAGLQVALNPHASKDPSLRGMDVVVGAVRDARLDDPDPLVQAGAVVPVAGEAGNAINDGLISFDQGNATMAGKSVVQGSLPDDSLSPVNGGHPIGAVLESSTSVSLNGRVDLVASYGAVINSAYTTDGLNGPAYYQGTTGLVELGSGSVLRILPEWGSDAMVIGNSLALNSLVDITGRNIHLGNGSVLLAPGAVESLDANGKPLAVSESGTSLVNGITLSAGEWFPNGNSPSMLLPTAGQIYLDQGAVIDASGSTDVQVDSAQNFLTLQLRGPELADSPLQKNGPIRGKDITIDIRNTGSYNGTYWVGTPLGKAGGYVGLIQKRVGQLTEAGGSVSLSAGDSVVMSPGSIVNVSGGWTQYSGGSFATTKLLTPDGRAVDISKATPDQVYTGILKDAPSSYEAPYFQGASGGSLSIAAPSVALEGGLAGNTVTGFRQLRATSTSGAPPAPSSFNLSLEGVKVNSSLVLPSSPYAPSVLFAKASASTALQSFALDESGNAALLPDAVRGQINLSEGLFSDSGFGKVNILNHDGSISIPRGVKLDAGLGGSVTMEAANVEVAGTITAPGGSISLMADLVPYDLIPLAVNPGDPPILGFPDLNSGNMRVESSAFLSTAGLLTSDLGSSTLAPIMIGGGSIMLAGHDTYLDQGALLDVSGGALVSSSAKLTYGQAGSLSIKAGADPQASGGNRPQTVLADIHDGTLQLGSTLRGYSGPGMNGGSLSLAATAFRIGGTALSGETGILPSFFNTGGFSSFTLAGIGVGLPGDDSYRPGMVIDQGTVIHPVIASQILDPSRSSLVPFLSPSPLRSAAQLSLSSAGTVDDNLLFGSKVLARGDLVMESGALINVDPQLTASGSGVGGSVSLSGNTVTINGSITVPGGAIKVAAAGDFPSNDQPPNYPQATLDLAPSAVLSTAGIVLTTIDPLGARSRFGVVLPGGSISLGGNILAEGGLLDVSGSSGVLDFLPSQLGLNQGGLVSSRIDSSGGSITLSGKKALYSDATLIGRSGGTTAAGGTVSFSSGSSENPFTLMIVQSGSVLPSTADPSIPGSKVGIELTLPDAIASPSLNGGGEVSLATILGGGFDSVTLGGGTFFSGPVTLSVPGTITAATAGTLSADNAVTLSAAHVVLGQKFHAPTAPGTSDQTLLGAPTAGAVAGGSLTVANARLIDLGNLSLQGIRTTSLSAPGGAIRGDGTLDVAGDLTMTAAEIYPAGSTSFKAVAYGYDPSTGVALSSGGTPGQIMVISSGTPEAPLSGGGSLGFYAESLTIGGSLFAPMGSIVLGGSGGSTDFLSNLSLPSTTTLTLQAGSLISVSGNGMALPYGSSPDGQKWLDPSGFDITYRGVPGKSITLSASQLTAEKGSSVDVSGGGTLEAPQWVYGLGGTINWTGSGTPYASQNSYRAGDLVFYGGSLWSAVQASSGIAPSVGSYWTKLPNSYAIVPGYAADYAPTGYSDGSIPFGQKVRLPGAGGLAAGDYTLLPVSYATLPGAYLISASGTGSPGSPVTRPDGSILLSGIVFNGMDGASGLSSIASSFTLSSPSVLAAKNEERFLQADTFFNSSVASPKPADGGRVQFVASSGMALAGSVSGSGFGKGVGARIDVSSPLAIVINADGTGDSEGALLLGAEQLSGWSFGSLLLGGSRGAVQADGTTPITVSSPSVTIQDGTKLAGNDIILVGGSLISLGSGASVTALGTSSAPDEVLTLRGDGLLLRVSSDSTVTSRRTGVDSLATQLGFTDGNGNPSAPSLSLANGSFLSGKGVILDSSALATVSPTATLNAASLSLTAGQIALLSSADLTSVDLDASSANALVLSSAQLKGFSSATSLAFTSYSSLDLYGSGVVGSPSLRSLTLHTGEIRGFDLSGGEALLSARSTLLDNPSVMVNPLGSDHPAVQPSGPGAVTEAADGTLRISTETLSLGVNGMSWDQFSAVSLEASSSVTGTASGTFSAGTGSLPSDLKISTPLVTTLGGVTTALSASGALSLVSPSPGASSASAENLQAGGALSLQGSSLSLDSSILLPGGSLTATALSGDLTIGNNDHARISVAGVSGKQGTFLSDVRTSDAGSITLISSTGSVILGAGSSLDLSAAQTSSAGSLSVTASGGAFSVDSQALINAKGGNSGGTGGSFTLDVGSLSSLSIIEPVLATAGFSSSQSFRIRSGDVAVDAAVKSHSFTVTADGGSIDVTGSINASGKTGGAIALKASGSVILEDGSSLSVRGDTYDAAGKGGSIFLSAGAAVNGVINPDALLDLRTGSKLDLGVKALPERIDQFGGTLHLRAPQLADGSDVQISEISSTITGASSVAVEAYKLYDLTPDGGGSAEISSVIPLVVSDAQGFLGAPGANSDVAAAILTRLTGDLDPSVKAVLNLAPGVEIINQGGDLTLSQDWDLSQFRTGANSAPGFLTLRASGNIALNASLSDGFSSSDYTATLLSHNSAMPANFQSWSYAITAGSDLTSANTRAVSTGSSANVTLGLPGLGYDPGNGANALTPQVIRGLYQVIRTGTGDISINASGDFQLWNQFSSVYTAGTLVPDQNLGGTFDTPAASMNGIETTSLGAAQQIKLDADGNPVFLQDANGNPIQDATGNPLPVYQTYPAQFTMAGGNISIEVGGNIAHKTYQRDSTGAVVTDGNGNPVIVDDSVRELPSNWLYRRGAVDPITGKFGAVANTSYQLDANGNVLLDTDGVTPLTSTTTEIISTAWWVDFSNFFEGVGALGGGNIAMKAGGTISNVDAVIPTQARMAGKTTLSLSDDASLGSVASQSGLALTTLASINGISVGMIRPTEGATLSVPNGNGDNYTVSAGDTLQTVADAFGVTSADLAAANNLSLADYVVMKGSTVSVPVSPSSQTLVETGGGDMTIRAGKNLDAGVYYVERGQGHIRAGGSIITNPSRDTFMPPSLAAVAGAPVSTDRAALPTTLFLGKSSFDVSASGNVLLGPAANVFLMPEGLNNGLNYNSYFSTLDVSSSVSVSSLGGSVTLRQYAANAGYPVSPILLNWYQGDVSPILPSDNYKSAFYQPWLRLNTGSVNTLASQTALQPASLQAVSFGGDIILQGSYTAAPSPSGNIVLDASGSVIGLSTDGAGSPTIGTSGLYISSTINLSDASPSSMPSPSAPVSSFNGLPFQETGSYSGDAASLQFQQQLHDAGLLHKNDLIPLQIVARSGDLTGITLFSPKRAQISSGGFIEDVGLYLQNLSSSDVSVVSAASGIIAFDDQTSYQRIAQAAGTGFSDQQLSQYKARITGSGDIQISGPGTLEVVSGGGIDLGNGPNNADGTGVGITSIGNSRNPALSFDGADIITMAGVNLPSSLDATASFNFTGLIQKVQTLPESSNYYQELSKQVLQGGDDDLVTALATAGSLSGILSSPITDDQKARLSLVLFSLVLRDAGRNHNKVGSPDYGTYSAGENAIAEMFGSTPEGGDINLRTQSIRTQNGGSIFMVAPGGGVSLASIVPPTLSTLTPPGIVTQHGGAIDVYTRGDVSIGIGRIFTLRGGDIMMWSDKGNIAAGSSAKTVATAPPTRVLIDPTSGNVETDLAGLATGGGIGVLATVKDAAVGNVDLIAPSGVIDAGDAGIRSSGNLNLAATKILNADNIAVAGVSVGAPAPASAASAPPPAPAPASAPAGASAAAAANNSAATDAAKNASSNGDSDQAPSIISIDILGYGGGGDDDDDAKKAASSSSASVQASL
jgi:filamentous hemagglutinin family protein